MKCRFNGQYTTHNTNLRESGFFFIIFVNFNSRISVFMRFLPWFSVDLLQNHLGSIHELNN